jgi:L-2-hydroxyglutarate oxidase LhgO
MSAPLTSGVERVDCVVAGAGVVGLAVARRLALAGREVVVVEAADAIGTETSSRNSEVIHAGIYYPTGSLKARLCVAGKEALYAYCAARGIAHKRLGKLIVATNEREEAGLAALKAKAEANGVYDLTWLGAAEARKLEPALRCTAALLSPSTGIIDSHALMLSLQGEAEAAGAAIAFETPLLRGEPAAGGVLIETGGAAPLRLLASLVVNCAGLDAPALSRRIAGAQRVPTPYLAKGSYFTLAGRSPFTRLIYPMPEPGGLGVHVTLDMAGQARFGPDVEWVGERRYEVDPRRAEKFYAAIRSYWPALPDGALQPGYSGIRPKISAPGAPAADFVIHGPAETGVAGYAALYGIESPGLTAALAIAEAVAEKLGLAEKARALA